MGRFENFDFEDFDFEEKSNLLTKQGLKSRKILISNPVESKQIAIKLKNMGFDVFNYEEIMKMIDTGNDPWVSYIYCPNPHGGNKSYWVRTKAKPINGICTVDDF